jgi:N-acetyl-anhydromuramyl-L-alanine amidase AmpD
MTADNGWMPNAERIPSPNFTPGRGGHTIAAVVLHINQSSGNAAVSWLINPTSNVSAHFEVFKSGRIVQMVSILDTAWANGLSYQGGHWVSPEGHIVSPPWSGLVPGVNPNATTVSIEHEGNTGEPWTDAMIAADAKILTWIGQQTGLAWRRHDTLIGHYEISPLDRAQCPGTGCAWDRIIAATGTSSPGGLTFVHAPRISIDTFVKVLTDAQSPAAPNARDLYRTIVDTALDPGICLAFMGVESSFGTKGRAVTNVSWANVRGFARYGSWLLSVQDFCERILNRYIKERGLTTVEAAVPVFAPAGPPDFNQPQRYIAAIHAFLTQWSTQMGTDYAAAWGPFFLYAPVANFGITAAWRKAVDAGHSLGRAVSDEYTDKAGATRRDFEFGCIVYRDGKSTVYGPTPQVVV